MNDHNAMLQARHERLRARLQEAGLAALALNPGPGLAYLTGLRFHLMERPTVAIFPASGDPVLVLPEFERARAEAVGFPLQPITYTEDLATWDAAFRLAAKTAVDGGARIGVEPRALRFLELQFLQRALPGAAFESAEGVLAALRMHKDADEAAKMKDAAALAERALGRTLGQVQRGMTERALAGRLVAALLQEGSEPELPFQPIVAFGPNSANPHATPTDRPLEDGDLVLFDWGAAVDGYFSDLTRVFAFGAVDPELERIAAIVLEANRAGVAAAAPGGRAGDVDAAARGVIEAAGYGARFIHRTGHGLGLEAHEEPYLRGDNDQRLAPGMAFTVEPGIYLPGKGGVRIEDDVVLTETGADELTAMPRELIRL